jgi:hypothetical protein
MLARFSIGSLSTSVRSRNGLTTLNQRVMHRSDLVGDLARTSNEIAGIDLRAAPLLLY